ncbi:kinase-like domain-containing protein [Thamnocephalis sphaerospora]|uniref:Kinase-like domain-containing protein n=1 Tax=Thamnocephalis sphaerospora TaxID=78915 RepID=A0A4V1IWN5_9FUNG|nr:kinase-like domain-containing protein [Thamnocephalis sphaerospora]|eukprot:RKP08179.1 kinase-like domain-containing protein [Thamnocephalis sphaerospora]
MHFSSAYALFAVAAAVLLSSHLSCAVPTQSATPSDNAPAPPYTTQPTVLPNGGSPPEGSAPPFTHAAGDWPNQPDLEIEKWYPEGKTGIRTALVKYKEDGGLLKCTPNVDRYNTESRALQELSQSTLFTEFAIVPRILGSFQTNNSYHCLVLELIKSYSLREYASMLKGDYKDQFISKVAAYASNAISIMHAHNIIHGNISPDSLYVFPEGENPETRDFVLIFTGFEGAQMVSNAMQPSIIKPPGFTPPEDFLESSVDQRKRDAWMLGATLYFMTNGMPPYGYTRSKQHGQLVALPYDVLRNTMKTVTDMGLNLFPYVRTKNRSLAYAMYWIMRPNPKNRSYVDYFPPSDTPRLFNYQREKSFLEKTWNMLKTKLPSKAPEWHTIPPSDDGWNPGTSTQDTNTRT